MIAQLVARPAKLHGTCILSVTYITYEGAKRIESRAFRQCVRHQICSRGRLVARKPKAMQPTAPTLGYAEWKARVRAETKRRDIPFTTLPERDLRAWKIADASPEEAADRAATEAHNAWPSFGRKTRR